MWIPKKENPIETKAQISSPHKASKIEESEANALRDSWDVTAKLCDSSVIPSSLWTGIDDGHWGSLARIYCSTKCRRRWSFQFRRWHAKSIWRRRWRLRFRILSFKFINCSSCEATQERKRKITKKIAKKSGFAQWCVVKVFYLFIIEFTIKDYSLYNMLRRNVK